MYTVEVQVQRLTQPPIHGIIIGHSFMSCSQTKCPWETRFFTCQNRTRLLYVQDQTGFHIGRIVIIHDLLAAQIVAYGFVIGRPVDRDYPIGSTVRELTPENDHRVDSQGRTFINGVAMDPGDFGSNTWSLENHSESQEDKFHLFLKMECW